MLLIADVFLYYLMSSKINSYINTITNQNYHLDTITDQNSYKNISIPEIYSLVNASRIIQPLWSCNRFKNRTEKKAKLVFLHVYKTAGSSIRALLREYSKRCHTSTAIVTHCTYLTSQSLVGGGSWMNSLVLNSSNYNTINSSCILKDTVDRHSHFSKPINSTVNSSYILDHVDILGGHFPLLGVLATNNNLRYFTFFRNSVDKFVSGNIFSSHKKKLKITKDSIVNQIKNEVNNEIRQGSYFLDTANYLLTPFQKNLELDISAKAELIMKNLISYGILIGMVDRMSESLELLHHIIDNSNKVNRLFFQYGMRRKSRRHRQRNTSRSVSTLSVIQELKKDEKFYEKFLKYVKYDQMVNDFAREIHFLQYQAFLKI